MTLIFLSFMTCTLQFFFRNQNFFSEIIKIFFFSEIMTDVIQATVKAHNKTPGKLEWRVLIVDQQSMRMVSACTKMHELSAEGITSKYPTV